MPGFGEGPGNALPGYIDSQINAPYVPTVLPGSYSDLWQACMAAAGQVYLVELYPYRRGATAGVLLPDMYIGTQPIGYIVAFPQTTGVAEFDYSDAPYTSPPAGSKQNTYYDGRVVQPLVLTRTLPIVPEAARRVTLEVSGIDIINADGALDDLVRLWAIDGRQIRVLLGLNNWPYNRFTPIFQGAGASWRASMTDLTVTARDQGQLFTVPLQSALYGGSGGADGTATLQGKPKPICFGQCLNITPAAVDPSNLIYQFHSASAQSVDAVYDTGATITGPDADYANYAALAAASVTSGHYATCLAAGMFRLGSKPAGPVTADTKGDNGVGYVNDTFSIVQRLLLDYCGLNAANIDTPAFSYMSGKCPGVMGWYQDTTPISQENALNALVGHCSCWWGQTLVSNPGINGTKITVGRLEAADPTAVLASFQVYDPEDVRIVAPQNGVFPPRWRQRVSYAKNWTVLNQNFAGSVTAARQLFLSQPYSVTTFVNGNTELDFLTAQDPPILQTLYINKPDADAEAQRLINMLAVQTLTVEIDLDFRGHLLPIGCNVQLTHPRINGGSPWTARVVEHHWDCAARKITCTLWGAAP